MDNLGKLITQKIGNAGESIGVAAGNLSDMAVGAAGVVGSQLGELREKSGEVIKDAGEGLSGIIGNVTHRSSDEAPVEESMKGIDEYEAAIIEYNQEYTYMSDNGIQLHHERERSGDLLSIVEELINSIANTPKDFQRTFDEIRAEKERFTTAEQYALEELNAARQSAISAGGGVAAGAAVASMAPSAAMWVATTFGTASTGTAISTLSGAAASQAALAWLGGGALAAGGAGTAGGSALLAMAGPIGWGVVGATLLTSIILFAKKRFEINQQKHEELLNIKENTTKVRKLNEQIGALVSKTIMLKESVRGGLKNVLNLYGANYLELNEDDRRRLGALVNNSKALGELMCKGIEAGE